MKRKPRNYCGQGHFMSDENTYLHKGSRHCRECRRIQARERSKRDSDLNKRSLEMVKQIKDELD